MDNIDNPVLKTLAAFANLCFKKEERAYFNRKELVGFLRRNKKEYPLALKDVDFHPRYPNISEQINDELFILMFGGKLCSWGPDFHPHEVEKSISYIYDKMPQEEKDYLQGLAKKMYDEVGCNRNGLPHKNIKSS